MQRVNPFFVLLPLLFLVLLMNLSFGAIQIPLSSVWATLLGDESVKESWRYILLNYRLPKAIVAILVGVALSVSGLLMQTLFRNPMAGPYVLGLSSGAGLGVALVLLGSSLLPAVLADLVQSPYGIALASISGSLVLLTLVLVLARKVQQTTTLLIVGLMFGSFANAMIGVLTYFSTAEQLKRFTFWSLGSLGNLTHTTIIVFSCCVVLGFIMSIRVVKALDALLLGERYATSMGISVKKTRLIIILATSILAGGATAFVGPIAFIGLAVPHIARLIFRTSKHSTLLLLSAFVGAILMLFCDMLTQFPGQAFVLPINAITSILGAPIVIALLLKKV